MFSAFPPSLRLKSIAQGGGTYVQILLSTSLLPIHHKPKLLLLIPVVVAGEQVQAVG